MADATIGSTYQIVNLVGPLFQLDPDDTPFLAMSGGLNGGRSAGSPIYTWQTETVGAGQVIGTAIAEGEDPTLANVDRAEIVNVCQIFNQAVEITYTKQASTNRLGEYGAGRTWSIMGDQPVQNELGHQLELATMSIARDVDWAFLNGAYQLPTDNTTGRTTRGLITAATTNIVTAHTVGPTDCSFDATGGAQEDLWTSAAHGYVVGDEVQFIVAGSAAPVEYVINTSYWVITVPLATTFILSATKGGAAIAGTADSTVDYAIVQQEDVTKNNIDTLMKNVFDQGGLVGGSQPVFFVNSWNKQMFSSIYGYAPEDRNVGGVNISTIETDFARVGVVIDRNVPQETILLADMSLVNPVTLPIPGKGHFFGEELATTGPKWNWMVYGEIGIEYGAERHHGVITGTTTVD